MWRRHICAACCAVVCGAAMLSAAEDAPADDPAGRGPADVNSVSVHDGQDVLDLARRFNREHPISPAAFPTGRVGVSRMPLPVERRRGGHFRIQLSQSDPILTPAVYDGKVFVGGGFGSTLFHCIDIRQQRAVWTASLSDNGASAPAYDDGTVVVNTESCTLFALDAATGRPLRSAWLGDPLIAAPAIADGRVLTSYPGRLSAQPSQPHVLACFDLQTGRPAWQLWLDGELLSTPIVDGGHVYAATVGGTLYKIRAADGRFEMARWCRATSAPVVVGNGICFTRRVDDPGERVPRECIARLDARTGQGVYAVEACEAPYLKPRAAAYLQDRGLSGTGYADYYLTPSSEPGMSSQDTIGRSSARELQEYSGARLLAHAGRLYNCMGRKLRCVEAATGKLVWSLDLSEPPYGTLEPLGAPPAVAGGWLFVGTLAGELLCVDAETGVLDERYPIGAPVVSQPVVWSGYVLVGTRDGKLVGINTGDTNFTGFGQWGGGSRHNGPAAASSGSERPPARALDDPPAAAARSTPGPGLPGNVEFE